MEKTHPIKADYLKRIYEVMDFVELNLDQELSLEDLSRMAFYSPFHFHRIFTVVTGETLNAFVVRKRIERIATEMLSGKTVPLNELAAKYGFNAPSSFSRSFKKFYGMSPSEFKAKDKGQYSKICKVDSKNGQEEIVFEQYICNINNLKNWIQMNAKIEVKEMPGLNLLGINHVGPYEQIGEVYGKLMQWAGPKGLLAQPNFNTVTVYHDNPKVTEISKIRQTACITIGNPVKTEGEVRSLSLDKGKFAVGRFEISPTEFGTAWDSMCVWVVENGYENRDGSYYELYHNDHMQHPEGKFILDICVPVV